MIAMLSWLTALAIVLAVIAIPGVPTALYCLLTPQGNEEE